MWANALLAATLLLATIPDPSHMAALVGHDRVSAVYQGFHRVESDATALAAVGVERSNDAAAVQDGIVIRKVRSLSAKDAGGFDLATALEITPKNPTMSRFNRSYRIVYRSRASVCGHRAFAFMTVNRITIQQYVPDFLKKQGVPSVIAYDMLNTHVVTVFNRDVWDADYARLYQPGIEKTQAHALVAFTSRYCVQPNYTGQGVAVSH